MANVDTRVFLSYAFAGLFALATAQSAALADIVMETSGRMDVFGSNASPSVLHVERTVDTSVANDVLELEISETTDSGQFIEAQSGIEIRFAVDWDGDVRADGTYSGPADFAELITATGGADGLEPGDVLIIDVNNTRSVVRSTTAHSTLVAGVYSSKPGYLGSEHDWDELGRALFMEHDDPDDAPTMKPIELGRMLGEVPVAVVGIVPCKVSAENGPISPGDLLVTSNTPGHAMRSEEPRPGTIVGKSLGSLDSGTGAISILVTLQ